MEMHTMNSALADAIIRDVYMYYTELRTTWGR